MIGGLLRRACTRVDHAFSSKPRPSSDNDDDDDGNIGLKKR
jgi:hypothetical protein